MDDKEIIEHRFPQLKGCKHIEVECKDGSVILVVEDDLTNDEKSIFKEYTREEVQTLLTQELGFDVHDLAH